MEWTDVISNPSLKDLPFKIELNQFGQLLMSPTSNKHGQIQIEVGHLLMSHLPQGQVIAECSIQTPDGVKVADVAWASAEFIDTFAYETPYPKASEICIEIVSPSNSKAEMLDKVNLYLAKGAQEVWIIYTNHKIKTYTHTGEIPQSVLVPQAQKLG